MPGHVLNETFAAVPRRGGKHAIARVGSGEYDGTPISFDIKTVAERRFVRLEIANLDFSIQTTRDDQSSSSLRHSATARVQCLRRDAISETVKGRCPNVEELPRCKRFYVFDEKGLRPRHFQTFDDGPCGGSHRLMLFVPSRLRGATMTLASGTCEQQIVRRKICPIFLHEILAFVDRVRVILLVGAYGDRPMIRSPNDPNSGHFRAQREPTAPGKQIDRANA